MSFPTYTSYRESEVEWLGHIPAHWDVDRLKASVKSCRNGIWGEEPSGGDDDVICVRVADFDRTSFRVQLSGPTLRSVTMKERSGRQLQKGDLLLEKSGGGDKQPVGAVVLYDHDVPAVCSNFVARIELADGMEPRFWTYVHAAMYGARLTERAINQTSGIQNLDQWRYFEERVPFPPRQEQTSIADFLDRETGKIDALIEEQKRLIALLKEKRQAVISHAVTQGLNPAVSTRDTGIDWLGEVPEHWDLVRLKDICVEIVDCKNRTPPEFPDGHHFVVRTSCVKEGKFDPSGGYFTNAESYEEWTRKGLPQGGDILFTREAPAGEACLVPEGYDLCLGQRMMYVRPNPALATSEFVLATIYGPLVRYQIESKSKGSTVGHLRVGEVGELPFLLPPIHEQEAISSRLEKVREEFDQLAEACKISTALLQERRSALISAAVTGKINVRGFVPDQAEAA